MLTQEFSSAVKAGEFAQTHRKAGRAVSVQTPDHDAEVKVWVVTILEKGEKAPHSSKSARGYAPVNRNTTGLPVRKEYGCHEIYVAAVHDFFPPKQRAIIEAERAERRAAREAAQ